MEVDSKSELQREEHNAHTAHCHQVGVVDPHIPGQHLVTQGEVQGEVDGNKNFHGQD